MMEISREHLINYKDLLCGPDHTTDRERERQTEKGRRNKGGIIHPASPVTPWKVSTDREESQNETMHSKDCDFYGQKPGYKLDYY